MLAVSMITMTIMIGDDNVNDCGDGDDNRVEDDDEESSQMLAGSMITSMIDDENVYDGVNGGDIDNDDF